MTIYSYTVGTGGHYGSYSAWQTDRLSTRNGDPALLPGDVEEAIVLNGTYTGGLNLSTSWPADITVRIKAQNHHGMDWAAAGGGVRVNATAFGPAFGAFGTFAGNIVFELVNLVCGAHASSTYRPALQMASTGVKMRLVNSLARGESPAGNHAVHLGGADTPLELVNSYVLKGSSTAGNYAISVNWASNQDATITARGGYIEEIYGGAASGQDVTFDLQGTLLKALPSPAGTVRTAIDCICPSGWSGWTATNCATAAFVDADPAVGEVAFVDRAAGNYRLRDHANNLAIDYCVTADMPADDIFGEARDGTPDCGPHEVQPPAIDPPEAPSDLTSSPASLTSIQLSWTDNATTEEGFDIQYRLQGDVSWTDATAAANASGYTLSGLTEGTYEFRVRAYNAAGDSAWTDIVTGSTFRTKAALSKGCGANVDRLFYYSPEIPFTNVAPLSAEWSDLYYDASTARSPADMDANGNPLSITGNYLRKVFSFGIAGFDDPDEEWVMLYDGVATLNMFNCTTLTTAPGRLTFKRLNGVNAVDITALGSPLPTNFRFMRVADEATYLTQPFRQDFLDRWASIGTFRYLNWTRVGNVVEGSPNWADRPTPSLQHTKYSEVALEWIIAHSNATGADCWVTVPHIASDDFMQQMAILFRDTMTAGQRVYVEFSNECWNYGFAQATYCYNRGQDSTDPIVQSYASEPYTAAAVWYGKRTKEMFDIWSTVFAGQMHRLVKVVGLHAVSSWGETAFLYPGLAEAADAVALAPYLGGGYGSIPGIELETNAQIVDRLNDDIDGGLRPTVQGKVALHRATKGLRVVAYEGGQHLYPPGSAEGPINDKFIAVNRDPLIGPWVTAYMTAWHQESDDLFCWYKTTSSFSRYGYWGLREHPSETSAPKMDAYLAYVASVNGAPAAPTSFSEGATTASTATIGWTDNATDESAYVVEYRVEGDEAWQLFADDLAANSTGATITGLEASTTYDVRVRATNSYGASAWLVGQVTTQASVPAVGSGGGSRRGAGLRGLRPQVGL